MPLRFHILLACASTAGFALPACSRESPRSTEPAARPEASAKKHEASAKSAETAPLDWRNYRTYLALPSHVGPNGDFCSARLALETATQKLWRIDGLTRVELPSESLPRGYGNFWHDGCAARSLTGGTSAELVTPTVYQKPTSAAFTRLVAPPTSIFWMSEGGMQCVRVDVRAFERPPVREARDPAHSNPSVEAFASVPVPADATWGRLEPESEPHSFIPFVAVRPSPGHLGYLLMGTWQRDGGKPLLKCQCERLLRIMRLDGDEIHMLPRRLPGDPDPKGSTVREPPKGPDEMTQYDSGEVERWFWDAATCEKARTEANAKITDDGRLTVRSGFYSGYSELD